MSKNFYTLKWENDFVSFIDQRLLPTQEVYVRCDNYIQLAKVIEDMVVRGAPAIGVAAAFGVALGVLKSNAQDVDKLKAEFKIISETIKRTRPTAVNLAWAVDEMQKAFNKVCAKEKDITKIKEAMINEAKKLHDDDIQVNRAMGSYGKEVIKNGMNILTHCNAGALATVGYGTALGVIRAAVEEGKKIHVYADETRPFLQGARLTMWELMKDNIPCTLVSDNMGGYLMANKKVDLVVVGADRIAANGDAANKIGTYSVAVLAKYHNIPVYFAAPVSTIDMNCPDGSHIPIEQRSLDEIKKVNGKYICPENANAVNPSFDVTPNSLIAGIITNKGIIYPPYDKGLKTLFKGGVS
ncbi:MAG: S-methyl-5-thioribose-1-phosphate isomerase [Pseudomonadota bacterium]